MYVVKEIDWEFPFLQSNHEFDQGDADSSWAPGLTSGGVRECPPWYSIVGATVTVHQFFCILRFCHTCSLFPSGACSTVPREGFDSSVIMHFSWCVVAVTHLYSVGPHPVSSLHIYTFVVSRAFMAGAASKAGDADSPGHLVPPLVCRGL